MCAAIVCVCSLFFYSMHSTQTHDFHDFHDFGLFRIAVLTSVLIVAAIFDMVRIVKQLKCDCQVAKTRISHL